MRPRRDWQPVPVAERSTEYLELARGDEDGGEQWPPWRAQDEPCEHWKAHRALRVDPAGEQRKQGQAQQRPRDRAGEDHLDQAVARGHEQWNVVQTVAVHTPHQRPEDLESCCHADADPHLHALLLGRLQRRQVQQNEGERAERPLLPQRGYAAVREEQERRVREQVRVQPVRLEAIEHRGNSKTPRTPRLRREFAGTPFGSGAGLRPAPLRCCYLMVPRSSMRLPWRVHPLPPQWITCSCVMGKWSLEVVLTFTPGSRNGLVSLSWLAAMFITFLRVMTEPACVRMSTIVYATATP